MNIAQTEGYYIRKPQLHALHHPAGELTAHETIYLKDFKVFRWHENFKKCFDACGITTWTWTPWDHDKVKLLSFLLFLIFALLASVVRSFLFDQHSILSSPVNRLRSSSSAIPLCLSPTMSKDNVSSFFHCPNPLGSGSPSKVRHWSFLKCIRLLFLIMPPGNLVSCSHPARFKLSSITRLDMESGNLSRLQHRNKFRIFKWWRFPIDSGNPSRPTFQDRSKVCKVW